MFYEVHSFQNALGCCTKTTEMQLIKSCLHVPEMQLPLNEMQILLQHIPVLTEFPEKKLGVFCPVEIQRRNQTSKTKARAFKHGQI